MTPPVRQSLFVYGLLMEPDLLRALTGRRYRGVPARLPGYARLTVDLDGWPPIGAAAAAPGREVNGLLLRALDAAALALLDRFENVAERLYRRTACEVLTGDGRRHPAQVYLAGSQVLDHLGGEWDARAFRAGYLDYYREQVIPHFLRECNASRLVP